MNSILNKIVLLLIVVFMILGYLFYKQNQVAQQQLMLEITSLKQQAKEQGHLIQEQNQAIEDLPNREKELSQAALNMTYIAQGFQNVSMFKVYIAEYYMMNGEFPNNNAQLRLSAPSEFATQEIKTVSVNKGGIITIIYTKKSGVDGGTISFTPTYKNNQLYWQCSTQDFATISQYMPQCKFL